MATPRILLIEDEPGLTMTLSDRLNSEGYVVTSRTDGDSGLEEAMSASYDLILLDVMLPKRSGFDVLRKLRETGVLTPVLMLTARGEVVEKVVGLKTGADDYVTKPFEMMELLARIEALLRRAPRSAPGSVASFRFGDVQLDFRRAEVLRAGEPVNLSAREFHLLRYLVEHRGETLSREQLLRDVWGYGPEVMTRTVDVHMVWLRQKLEQNPRFPEYFLTARGLGYKFAG
jgi:two-component system, OmpR family, alkaline phosphatase synthesis response regulator PhoP